MAAKPKLLPEEWAEIKKRWENDPRKGYAWLVKEMGIPVSRPAIHKVAVSEGWSKSTVKKSKKTVSPKSKNTSTNSSSRKISKVTKVAPAKVTPAKVTVTINEDTINEDANRGRPTLYTEEYAEQAFKLCLLGATDKDLADFFGVTEQTINNWKKDHTCFFDSLKRGKMMADAEVAHSLYKRANGYSHPAAHISNFAGEITVTEYVKHYPPDTAAAFIFLKNRQPGWWKDKVEASVDVKLDKETLQQIEETFLARMEKARIRQDKILIERGILIEQEAAD